jgi:hypothetical protein
MAEIPQRPLGEFICARLTAEIRKLGFAPERLAGTPVFDQADFHTSKDPFSGEDTLCGSWRNTHGYRVGELKVHGDGSFYAEYDVALPHPTDPRWFVEGVIAWGKHDTIKSEAKLLPALEE